MKSAMTAGTSKSCGRSLASKTSANAGVNIFLSGAKSRVTKGNYRMRGAKAMGPQMVVMIGGQQMYIRRAVDGEGEVLDVLV